MPDTEQHRTADGSPEASAGAGAPGPTTLSVPRPRFTGRAVVLVLVLLVLLVSYASSTKAYLQQRGELGALQERIDGARGELVGLQRERQRWRDQAFVAQQARERFGFVMPGEVGYQVIGGDGQPLDRSSTLTDPTMTSVEADPTWFQNLWGSAQLAGNPGSAPDPAERLDPPGKQRVPRD